MSESRPPPRGKAWQGNPLLNAPPPAAPSFARADWDEPRARPFGPWRVVPATSPLDAVHQVPPPAPAQAGGPGADTAPPASPDTPTLQALRSAPRVESSVVESPAQAAAREQALRTAIAEAHARGLAEGQAQARRELADDTSRRDALQHEITAALQALALDPQRCFEPLRRLALHLAEQLVRGALHQSADAIDRLVRLSLDQLPGPLVAPVISLHPEDLALLAQAGPDLGADARLEADPTLARGSVRVAARDGVVEDFIEHRLEALAADLLGDPQAWRARSALLPRSPETP